MQRGKIEDESEQQRRRRRCEPPNPLVRHVPPRNAEPEASGRIHLRPCIARDYPTRGERDEAQAATREERGQARSEEEALAGVDADAVGDVEIG